MKLCPACGELDLFPQELCIACGAHHTSRDQIHPDGYEIGGTGNTRTPKRKESDDA